jgi:hypothetical protein
MSVEMNSFKQAFSLRLVRVSTSPAGTSHAFFIVFMNIRVWLLTGTSGILKVARGNIGLTASLLEKMKYIYSSAGKRSGHEITRSDGQSASPCGQSQPPQKGQYYQGREHRETMFRLSADRPRHFPCELRCLKYCTVYISESLSFKPESPLERVSSVPAFSEYLCRTTQVQFGCKDVDSSSTYMPMANRPRANKVSWRYGWMWMDLPPFPSSVQSPSYTH